MELIRDEHYFYTLEREESTDEYFLEALCGTVAQYTLRIRLTADEIAAYMNDPDSVLTLAQRITDSPHSFLSRRV